MLSKFDTIRSIKIASIIKISRSELAMLCNTTVPADKGNGKKDYVSSTTVSKPTNYNI